MPIFAVMMNGGERGDVWSFKAMEANPALEGQLPIPDSTITIAKILNKAGYKTALIGALDSKKDQ